MTADAAGLAAFWEHWGPRLRREYELEKRGRGEEWPSGVCFKVADPVAYDLLRGQGRIRYVPKQGQLNVLWASGEMLWASGEISKPERSLYDLVVEGPVDSLIAGLEGEIATGVVMSRTGPS